MIISPGRGYIFVHIPKTGGTAMALALEARAKADDVLIGDTPKAIKRRRRLKDVQTKGRLWKHSRLADLPGLMEEAQLIDLFAFTLVRNPWDRAVSYYHWLRTQSFDHPAVGLSKTLDFTEFLQHPHTQAAFRAETYGGYMRLPSGTEHCRAFVRLEHLAEDLAPVEAHLGFKLAGFAPANQSRRERDYSSYYTDESSQLLADVCATDIARFGYRYGS